MNVQNLNQQQNATYPCFKGDYSSTKPYRVNDVIINNRHIYICNTAITTGETFTPHKWTQIGESKEK